MPMMMDFIPANRFTPIFSAIYKITRNLLGRVYEFLREHNPTLNNIANAYEKSTDISHIVTTAARHNVVYYAVPIIGVKMLFAPVRSYLPFSSSIFMVAEESVMMSLAVSLFASNILYNLALTKAVVPHLPPRGEHIPACQCGEEQKISTNAANAILYICLLAFASTLGLSSSILPESLALLLQAMAYGYSLAGLQYSAYGVCATHFSEALNNNKMYYLSLGATVIYTVKQTSATVRNITGTAPNFYLEDAIFSLVWQQAIIFVVLQEKSPDYLHNFRLSIKDYMEKSFKQYLDNSPPAGRRDYVKRLNQHLVSPLGSSLFSMKPIQLALNLHQTELNTALEWLAWLNARTVTIIGTHIIDVFPNRFTPPQAKILSTILKQQDWQQTEAFFKLHLAKIESRRTSEETRTRIEVIEKKEEYMETRSVSVPDSQHGFFPHDVAKSPASRDDEFEEINPDEDEEPVDAVINEKGHQVAQTSFRNRRFQQ
ncbi:MAG: hypothetical protein V4501_06380 [Pseudomonadota bacterium]